MLELNSKYCSSCGESVDMQLTNNKAINDFEYSQKGNSKSFKAKFTDDVGVYFASAFNNVISGSSLVSRNPFKQSALGINHKSLNSSSNTNSLKSNFQDAEIVGDFEIVLAKVFKANDTGKLEIIDNRLKEKSKLDKMKRLVVLFMYAQKQTGVDSVSREDINEIVSSEKLLDSNYRAFLSKDALKYLSAKTPGYFSLLSAGEEYAQTILTEIGDESFIASKSKGGRKPGKKTSSSITPSTTNSNSKNKKDPSALEMMTSLVAEDFFNTKKKLNDIVMFCEQKKARKYSPQNINFALNRMIKDQTLEREKNSDNQYEYWKK